MEEAQLLKVHDPNSEMVFGPSIFRAIDEDFLAVRSYLVTSGDSYYLYTKEGKNRNPAITFDEREWQRITITEVDISTGFAIANTEVYNNPDPLPFIQNNPLELNHDYSQDI